MEPEVIYNKVQIMLQLEIETFFKHESVLLSYIEQQWFAIFFVNRYDNW